MRLVIGNYNYSSWSMRAWLALKATRLEFEVTRLCLDTPEFKRRIAKYSPTRQVPVLDHEGLRIWDTLAICEYLAERYPHAQLWPSSQRLRALARSACAEMHSGFPQLRSTLPFNARARGRTVNYDSATHSDVARICELWDDCRAAAGHAADQGPWLFGNFSAADCFYVPVALRFATYRIGLVGYASAYVAAVVNDPIVKEWLTLAEAEKEIIVHEEVDGHV